MLLLVISRFLPVNPSLPLRSASKLFPPRSQLAWDKMMQRVNGDINIACRTELLKDRMIPKAIKISSFIELIPISTDLKIYSTRLLE